MWWYWLLANERKRMVDLMLISDIDLAIAVCPSFDRAKQWNKDCGIAADQYELERFWWNPMLKRTLPKLCMPVFRMTLQEDKYY